MFQQPNLLRKEEADAIVIENISKHFKIPHEKKQTVYENFTGLFKGNRYGYEEFWALRNISFSVKRGETLGIIGENGSGKSTLLKVIAGVLYPDSGRVKVNGRIAPFLELGVGFQPELTAEENVRLYGSVVGMSKKQINNKIDAIFEFAELERFRNGKLKNFSSGMYMKLAFSTAVATNPDILLIDEVLAVGDEAFQEKSLNKIKEFKKEKKTIVLVSHDSNTIKNFCENAILIYKGEIAGNGISNQIVDQYHAMLSSKQKELSEKKVLREEIKSSAVNDETKVIDLPKPKRYGTMDAEIVKTELYNEMGERTTKIKSGENTIILTEIKFNKDVNAPIIGISITRQDGLNVYATNTRAVNMKFDTFKNGEKIMAKFTQCMRLNEGVYHIAPAIAYTDGNRFCDWQNEALTFSVTKDKELYGLIDLMSEIEVSKKPLNMAKYL
jgi:lipopolysaccharide transport system ATP-binding protein